MRILINYVERVFTLQIRLSKSDIIYYEDYISVYSQICRRIYQDMRHRNSCDSKYVSTLMKQYNVTKRTVNSAVKQMRGRINALIALQKVNIADYQTKIKSCSCKVDKLTIKINRLKLLVIKNPNDKKLVLKYHNLKSMRYTLQNKINKLRIKTENYERDDINNINICFGSRKLFKAQFNLSDNGFKSHEGWLNAFRKARDCQVYYVGSSDETCGNQMFQMVYDKLSDSFILKIRKELAYSADKENKYLYITVNFKHRQELLKHMLELNQAMSYYILHRDNKWYVTVSFRAAMQVRTDMHNGCVGLDFNSGFISLSETDRYGNLAKTVNLKLNYHGTGNKAKTEMRYIVNRVVSYTLLRHKALVIEGLSFKSKKAGTLAKSNKSYNKMIHALDYSRYKQYCNDCAIVYGVMLIEVNPAYTSVIGKNKYGKGKKLCVHNAAAYVIARRGQGYTDEVI